VAATARPAMIRILRCPCGCGAGQRGAAAML